MGMATSRTRISCRPASPRTRLCVHLYTRLRAGVRFGALLVASAFLIAGVTAGARAQIGSERYSSIVIDAANGAVVSSASPDGYRFPASLTKMMTAYMLFEALRDRRVSLQQAVPVSPYAASMSPTKLGLLPGTYITVEQALLGLVTKSANDAAAALGELLGGDEDRFAQMMTLRARSLGMSRTTFRNASGLPDWEQVTTARDMATLSQRLIRDFPGQYHYFSTPSFVWRGRTVVNHARMLQSYEGADGLKTGYTIASGFNLATSALRGNTRLIGVVLGAASSGERDLHMASLLDHGFDQAGEAPVFVQREAPLPALIAAATAAAPAALARTVRPFALRTAAGRDFRPRALAASRAPASRTTAASAPVQRVVGRAASRTDRVKVARQAVPQRAAERARVQVIRAAGASKPVKATATRPQPVKAGALRLPSNGRIRG